MASTDKQQQQNIWFGVAMFLIGLIAGAILTLASGSIPMAKQAGGTQVGANVPAAPQAPQAPQAPKESINDIVIGFGKTAGVDEEQFKTCLTTTKFDDMIAKEESDGQTAGVNGTPGNVLVDLKTGNARLISGAQPPANFKKNIDELLKDPNAKPADLNTVVKGLKPVDFKTDHTIGSTDAKLAIVEYTDYQCPFCHAVHPTIAQLMKDYDGKVVWVLRHFPLSFHPNAHILAVGAECANEIGGADGFWKYTDAAMTSNNVN